MAVTKTIGGTSPDYSDIDAWVVYVQTQDTGGLDDDEVGQMREGNHDSQVVSGISINKGFVPILEGDPNSAGAADEHGALSHYITTGTGLVWNRTDGAIIRGIDIQGKTIIRDCFIKNIGNYTSGSGINTAGGTNEFTIRKCWLLTTSATASCIYIQNYGGLLVEDCVLEAVADTTVLWNNNTGSSGTGFGFFNCTLMCPIDVTHTESCVHTYSTTDGLRLHNCAIYGFNSWEDGNSDLVSGSAGNSTDLASMPTNYGGLTSQTYGNNDPFIEARDGTGVDWTINASSELDGAQNNGDGANETLEDIIGTTRDTTNPSIGAWELTGGAAAYVGNSLIRGMLLSPRAGPVIA